MPWEVSRSHSSGSNKPGAFSRPLKLGIPEILMTTKGRTEGSPPITSGMDADANTADRRKSEPKCPDAESAKGTTARNLPEQIAAPVPGIAPYTGTTAFPPDGTARCRAARRVVWDLWPIELIPQSVTGTRLAFS